MSKGSSGKKMNQAAKKNRKRYKDEGRQELNKQRKAMTERNKQAKLLYFGKGIYKDRDPLHLPSEVHCICRDYGTKRLAEGKPFGT